MYSLDVCRKNVVEEPDMEDGVGGDDGDAEPERDEFRGKKSGSKNAEMTQKRFRFRSVPAYPERVPESRSLSNCHAKKTHF